MQPGNPFQFHQRPAIAPHSEPLEHILHLHSQFRKTPGDGQLAGCTESDNGAARYIKYRELLDYWKTMFSRMTLCSFRLVS